MSCVIDKKEKGENGRKQVRMTSYMKKRDNRCYNEAKSNKLCDVRK